MRTLRLQSLRSKKYLILAGVLLAILLVGGYVLWSKQVWVQYTSAYTQWHYDLDVEINAVSALPAANTKEQDALLSRFDRMSQRISSQQASLCSVTSLVQWQKRLIAEYDASQIICQKKTADVVSFQKQLDKAIAYIKNDRELAKIITTALPSSELADDTWDEQVSVWGKAIESTDSLKVGDDFKPTQQQASDRMTAIKVAWQDLIAANQAKDKAAYVAAQNKLGASYDGLNAIVTDSEKRLSGLLNSLNSAYERSK